MNTKKEHIKNKHRLAEDWETIAQNEQPQFEKSKDEVWFDLMNDIDQPVKETKVIQLNWLRYTAAASITVLLCSALFARFYTVDVLTGNGQHLSEVLPDGSKVMLNAASSLSYHPYWWSIDRKVEFEGEGFFEVQKGSNFAVASDNGITEVLGTSFNINSRFEDYKVYCRTGKVSVSNTLGNVVLEPSEIAVSNSRDELIKSVVANEEEMLGWIDNRFVFNSAPLDQVLMEVEFQFDVTIDITDPSISDWKFSGAFNKTDNVKQTLTVIGNSMDLNFEQNATGKYSVRKIIR
jgi:transmembrane sensor